MKIQISPSGELEIFRSHGFKTQKCIFTEAKSCGDRCPHFSEPMNVYNDSGTKSICITICNGKDLFSKLEEFEDLRTKQISEYDYKFDSPDDAGDKC